MGSLGQGRPVGEKLKAPMDVPSPLLTEVRLLGC